MLRFAEIGLFLAPFIFFLLWRYLSAHVRPALLWTSTVVIVALAGIAIGYGLKERMDPHSRYLPAHSEGGQIIQGRAVPN